MLLFFAVDQYRAPFNKGFSKKKKKQKEEGHNEHFVVHDAATGTAVEQVPGGAMW
jgi:hypothetical protein